MCALGRRGPQVRDLQVSPLDLLVKKTDSTGLTTSFQLVRRPYNPRSTMIPFFSSLERHFPKCGRKRPHKHKDPTKHGFWNPRCLGPQNQNLTRILMLMWSLGHSLSGAGGGSPKTTSTNPTLHVEAHVENA